MSPEAQSAATPETRTEEEENPMLDDVIERIEQSLPAIHLRASNRRTKRRKPSEEARMIFLAMSKDPLLTESGDDIQVTPRNGTHPD